MFEPVRFCCLCYFEFQGQKSKKFQNFIQIVRSLESNNCNATTNDMKIKKTYRWTLWISMVRNGMVLQEVAAFCHVTCRYFNRFLLQGVDRNWRQACFFYLAPGLICKGYWQVNSQRSIFRIADPTYVLYAYVHTFACTLH